MLKGHGNLGDSWPAFTIAAQKKGCAAPLRFLLDGRQVSRLARMGDLDLFDRLANLRRFFGSNEFEP
jgi:uncharacterized protein (UPF0261 family)